MKRVIKYWNKYQSDEALRFSDCSTEREILPILVPDDAGEAELLAIAQRLALEVSGSALEHNEHTAGRGYTDFKITHAVQVGTKQTQQAWREPEVFPVYLGFITLPKRGPLPVLKGVDTELTKDQVNDVLGELDVYGIHDVGETVDGGIVLVKSGWDYFHAMPLLGYSLKSFEHRIAGDETWDEFDTPNIEHGFYDDTQRCDECGKFDNRDDGYNYNFREFEGDWLGIRCGCFDEACKGNIDPFVNNTENCMELSVAESLESDGELEHVERFISGMVDGRGGSFNGEYCREGDPKTVLDELLKAEPDGQFVFTHDESGQFQSYFSVWRVVDDETNTSETED